MIGRKVNRRDTEELPLLIKCEMCKEKEFKYTCPRCLIKTCSVNCVKAHKNKFTCTGLKDKFKANTNLKEYKDADFFRDIRYINDTINSINSSNKAVFEMNNEEQLYEKDFAKQHRNLKRIAKKFNGINYHKSPIAMQRYKENKSYSNSYLKKIFWTIKFIFVNEEKSEHLFNDIQFDDETVSLYDIILYLNQNKKDVNPKLLSTISDQKWFNKVKFLYKMNTESLDVFDQRKYLKRENYFYEICDINMKLREILKGKDVYEYPEFYII